MTFFLRVEQKVEWCLSIIHDDVGKKFNEEEVLIYLSADIMFFFSFIFQKHHFTFCSTRKKKSSSTPIYLTADIMRFLQNISSSKSQKHKTAKISRVRNGKRQLIQLQKQKTAVSWGGVVSTPLGNNVGEIPC